jgi:hypothetical protein
MYWVKEQGIGQEGLLLLDSQDAVEEMIDHSDFTVLNITSGKQGIKPGSRAHLVPVLQPGENDRDKYPKPLVPVGLRTGTKGAPRGRCGAPRQEDL